MINTGSYEDTLNPLLKTNLSHGPVSGACVCMSLFQFLALIWSRISSMEIGLGEMMHSNGLPPLCVCVCVCVVRVW